MLFQRYMLVSCLCVLACTGSNRSDTEEAGGGEGGANQSGGDGGASSGTAGSAMAAGRAGMSGGGGGAMDPSARDAAMPADAGSGLAGNNGARDAMAAFDTVGNLIPSIVGVGYAGVRIRSIDNGITWKDLTQLAPSGGDDENLLRAVAYGKGLWATGGWKYLTSVDGVTWTQRTHPCGGGVVDGLAFGNQTFVATCGSTSFVSPDGLKWSRGGRVDTGGHPKVVFGGGKFAGYGDNGQVYESIDGVTWSRLGGLTDAASCMDTIKSRQACGLPSNGVTDRGVWLRGYTPALGGGGIFRSVDGKTYTRASSTNVETFAFGFSPSS